MTTELINALKGAAAALDEAAVQLNCALTQARDRLHDRLVEAQDDLATNSLTGARQPVIAGGDGKESI